MSTAENMKTARQPNAAVRKLASGRDNMMPARRPPMMLPMTRPRIFSGDRCAASGSRICAPTDETPSANEAMKNGVAVRLAATPIRLKTTPAEVTRMSRRFSIRSPRQTTKNSPAPKPSWVSVTIMPARFSGTPRLCAIGPTSDWA